MYVATWQKSSKGIMWDERRGERVMERGRGRERGEEEDLFYIRSAVY